MSLTTFTIDHRQKLVTYLSLPIQEVEEGSRLYAALQETENRDQRLNSTFAAQVISRLAVLDSLDPWADSANSEVNTSIESVDSQATAYSVAGEYSLSFGAVSAGNFSGSAGAKMALMKKVALEIKQLLGLYRQPTENLTRVTFPGGMAKSSRTGWR